MIKVEVFAGLRRKERLTILRKLSDTDNKMTNIVRFVSQRLDIPFDQIMDKSRKRNIVLARMICMNMILKTDKFTLIEVGRFFRKDHSTIIYNRDTYKELLETNNKELLELLKKL